MPENNRNSFLLRADGRRWSAFIAVTAAALGLYLPFLCIQYDTNGLVEAMAVENGPLLNKNHMLYRPVGRLVWRALQLAGYSHSALPVLQVISAMAAAIGIGCAFWAFKSITRDLSAALIGSAFLATSFTYWVSATDVFYIPVAGMFAAAALAVVVDAKSDRATVTAGLLIALSIFTWQGCIFLIPALLFFFPKDRRTVRDFSLFAGSTALLTMSVYLLAAFQERGFMGPAALWTWFTHYSENATLSIWGIWQLKRVPIAALSALDSVTAARLGIGFRGLFHRVQLGRVAVDGSIVTFAALMIGAIARSTRRSMASLAAYFCFLPFIVWWDPGSHKWFLIPNIFLAAFLACGLVGWFQYRYARPGIVVCLLIIAGTNFLTTVRPRHQDPGQENRFAECVARQMNSRDLFIAAEWGWPDYLPYIHKKSTLNIINEYAQFQSGAKTLAFVRQAVNETRAAGGKVYMTAPNLTGNARWLSETTGLTTEDLSTFRGTPAFVCHDTAINEVN